MIKIETSNVGASCCECGSVQDGESEVFDVDFSTKSIVICTSCLIELHDRADNFMTKLH